MLLMGSSLERVPHCKVIALDFVTDLFPEGTAGARGCYCRTGTWSVIDYGHKCEYHMLELPTGCRAAAVRMTPRCLN